MGKVGNGRVLQAERIAWVPALRLEDIYWTKISQCDWDTGNVDGVMQVKANFCKIYGFRTLFQKLLEVSEEYARGNLDA